MKRRATAAGMLMALGVSPLASAQDAGARAPAIAPPPSVRPVRVLEQPRVRITVIAQSSKGKVFCAMWRGSDGYPTKRKKAAHDGVDRRLKSNRAMIVIEDVEPGEYAVACFHDENANNDLDTNFLGIPVEGTGASNDARGFLGPPPYDDARFRVRPNETKQVIVPMHYLF